MKNLKQKIEQWFIDNSVPVEHRAYSRVSFGFMVLWSPDDMSHCLRVHINPGSFDFDLEILIINNAYKPIIIKNQTEENIFQLLNCLLNHIK